MRNATVSPSRGCPTDVSQMCKMDYSSWPAIAQSYKDLHISEVGVIVYCVCVCVQCVRSVCSVCVVQDGLQRLAGNYAVVQGPAH